VKVIWARPEIKGLLRFTGFTALCGNAEQLTAICSAIGKLSDVFQVMRKREATTVHRIKKR
jgi:hypothetical protein